MFRKLKALDAAVIDRCQWAADKVWDACGVTVGDVVCAFVVVVGAVSFRLDLLALNAFPIAATLLILAGASLHSWAQRNGRHGPINTFAAVQRRVGGDLRLFQLGLFVAFLVLNAFVPARPGYLVVLALAPVLLYAGTVMVRPRVRQESRIPARVRA